MIELKEVVMKKIRTIIKEDPDRANDQTEDNVRITFIIYAKNIFHGVQMVIFLLTVSFLFG